MTQLLTDLKNDQPDLVVTITPGYTNGEINYLITHLLIKSPALEAGDIVVKIPTELANIPTTKYDGNVLNAFDLDGELKLDHNDDVKDPPIFWRSWTATRATYGDIHILGTALPRAVNNETKTGPAFDLRMNNGGLIGSGYSFLPLPPDGAEDIQIKVVFDLKYALPGCQGIWTHAKSLSTPTTLKVAKPSLLHNSIYMVGPINSVETQANKDGKKETKNIFSIY